ncbi:MAG TPA: hypothetical protein ENH60_12455 [Pricia sp.]|nr:hypothetical protein [Pricia sp.]
MTPQTRREFLGKLGWMAVGSLIVPYVPETFYSIPRPVETLMLEINKIIAKVYNIPPFLVQPRQTTAFYSMFMGEWEARIVFGTGEKQPLGLLSIGDLI